MTPAGLARKSIRYYFREHLASGAATAVSVMVLTGAFLVGDSVRGSLRAAFTGRLGEADHAVLARYSFLDDPERGLAARLSGVEAEVAPVYRLPGAVLRDAGPGIGVTVFGVDERFFRFHGLLDPPIGPGAIRLGPGTFEVAPGDSLVLRLDDPSAVAASSLFGDKEGGGNALRRVVEAWPFPDIGPASGDFALFPAQGGTRAVFLGLDDLRRALGEELPRANTLLIRGGDAKTLDEELARNLALDDFGLRLQRSETGDLVLTSRAIVLDDPTVEAARRAAEQVGAGEAPVLTYLATRMESNGRTNPYSLVSGVPPAWLPGEGEFFPGPWLQEDLGLMPGDRVRLEFLRWETDGRYREDFATLTVGATVSGEAFFDRTLAPEVPGVSDSIRIGDWDPPFPVDLGTIRPKDEAYWEEFRALPKAFVPLPVARELWGMREGRATSVRFPSASDPGLRAVLLRELPPARFGLEVIPVREQGLEASVGATDFGAYFLYFSWFLLVSAVLLIVLLYRLGMERRLPEIGVLLSSGWSFRAVAGTLLREAAVVASGGAVFGSLLGLGYGWLMVLLLGGVFEGAIAGTLGGSGLDSLRFLVSWSTLAAGALLGGLLAVAASWITVRRLVRRSPRSLLHGVLDESAMVGGVRRESRFGMRFGPAALAVAFSLLGGSALGLVPAVAGFFGAGVLFLAGALLLISALVRRELPVRSGLAGLGWRGLSFRPGRSLTAMALVGFASFTLIAVESFRKREIPGELPEGAGGFLAVTETVFGVPWNPATEEGREALGLPPDLDGFDVVALRLAGDEDASCLNLYQPDRPRVAGVPKELAESGRFRFAAHLGETEAERGNPFRLFYREREPGDPVPVIGDQNSMTYVLKWRLGEEREFAIGPGGDPVRLVLVATLQDSLFQSELLMAEEDFLDELAEGDGYRMFLARGEPPTGGEEALLEAEREAGALLDDALGDSGAVASSVRGRLREFHRVENAYLSTFQALGGLGLLLGVLGLIAILLRNAHERRREWALLAATGYQRRDFIAMGFWENAFVLVFGLIAGALSALLSVLPALERQGFGGSLLLLLLLFIGVLGFGLLSGWLAARTVASRPVVESLRAG